MTTSSLVTVNYKKNTAERFIESFANNQYYLFVSNHIDANTAVRPFDNEVDTIVSCYHGMIFGKKIHDTDTSVMIRRIDWQSNTVYDQYDHRATSLYDLDYYVVVNEGSQWNVFKCLENGNGNPSVVQPSITNVSSSNENFFFPNDGYRWKYMYTISSDDYNQFATDDYLPVLTDPIVSQDATAGSIDVITVDTPGKGYNNYISGQFGVGDIRLNGDQVRYGLTTPGINTTNGYYDGCWLYISSGAGAGQYRLIDSYQSNATHNFIILSQQFDDTDRPQNGSTFDITPSVKITGDGRETSFATARAIIDPNGNTINRVEMIDSGSHYYHAMATVLASNSVGITQQCVVTPIISPTDGHGFSAERELGGEFAGVSLSFNGNENGTIITNNDYSQIGIIRNPTFNSVEMTLSNQNRDFFTSEWVYKIDPIQLAGTVSTNLDSNNNPTAVLTVNSVNAYSIAQPNTAILLNYANNYQIANIFGVSNNYIVLDRNVLFNTGVSSANIHLANISSKGRVNSFSSGAVILTDSDGAFESGDKIIGATTGTYGVANTITITTASKTEDTFLQVYTYIGSVNQGSFIADEVVYQVDNISANARFHSSIPDANTSTTRMYFTNQNQIFNSSPAPGISNQIIGATSGAIATLTNNFLPDLVFASGEIVYIEYGDSITRTDTNSEQYQLIFAL